MFQTRAFEHSPELKVIPQEKETECAIKLQRSLFFHKVLQELGSAGDKYCSNEEGMEDEKFVQKKFWI